MKTSLICGAALAILGLAAVPVNAQTQTTESSTSTGYMQTSKIIGTKVKTAKGEEVGVVKDVVLVRSNGCMAYTVLSAGGGGTRVTGQGKLVAVPWSVYTVSPDASYLTVGVERDRIYNAPVSEYSRIGDTALTSSVYSAFGVSAGVGYSSGTTSTSATTGVNTATGGNAQAQTRCQRFTWRERIGVTRCFRFAERLRQCLTNCESGVERVSNGKCFAQIWWPRR